jgi:hypothetical protein
MGILDNIDKTKLKKTYELLNALSVKPNKYTFPKVKIPVRELKLIITHLEKIEFVESKPSFFGLTKKYKITKNGELFIKYYNENRLDEFFIYLFKNDKSIQRLVETISNKKTTYKDILNNFKINKTELNHIIQGLTHIGLIYPHSKNIISFNPNIALTTIGEQAYSKYKSLNSKDNNSTQNYVSTNQSNTNNTTIDKNKEKFIFPREEYKKYHQKKNEENKKLEAFKKGEEFENYVENNLFPEKYFILLSKTHNYETNNKRYVEDSLKPDLKFKDKKTGKIFYVECKYRSKLYDDKFHWAKNDGQFNRYKDIESNENTETFIAMGLGGTPDNPDEIYLMPLKEIKYPALYPSVLRNWEITNIYDVFKIVNS